MMNAPPIQPPAPAKARPLGLTRPPDPPTADPVSTYTGILAAASRLSAAYDRQNPQWEAVISGYARAII